MRNKLKNKRTTQLLYFLMENPKSILQYKIYMYLKTLTQTQNYNVYIYTLYILYYTYIYLYIL